MMKKENEQKKIRRLYNKIFSLIKDGKAIFLTMTFNNEILTNTNAKTRRRYIKAYLKEETAYYIANKDFGTKNEREHYHALIKASFLTKKQTPSEYKDIVNYINLKAYKYGQIKADFVGKIYGFKTDEEKRTTAKNLTKHFLKDTTKGAKLIYAKGKPTKDKELERIRRYKEMNIKKAATPNNSDILDDALGDFERYKDIFI